MDERNDNGENGRSALPLCMKSKSMTKDLNKNISSIQYNCLNLPSKVTFGDGKAVEYVYDASGARQRTTYTDPTSATHTTDYLGNMLYEDGTLSQITTEGGYVSFTGSAPLYHFRHTDHLGNTRVVTGTSGVALQTTHYYPFGSLMGDISTGQDVQRFKYGGKELDRTNGLDWYDFMARQYDGLRFTTIDPKCEKYYNISPYVYCGNNPVSAVDLHGDTILWINEHLKSKAEKLKKKSALFSTLYDTLDKLPITISISVNTEGVNSAYKKASLGSLDIAGGYSEGNTIVFRDDAKDETISEEFFHSFQKYFYSRERASQEMDAEAKLFNSAVKFEMDSEKVGVAGIMDAVDNATYPAITYLGGICYPVLLRAMSNRMEVPLLSGSFIRYCMYLNEFKSRHSQTKNDVYGGPQRFLVPRAYNYLIRHTR